MKKIVYIISTLHRTGPTNILAGIVKNLDKNKFKPIIITLSPEQDYQNSWWQELEKLGIEVYSLNLSRIQSLFIGCKKLKQFVNEIKPDLIHCHCFRSIILSAAALKKYLKIATVHSDYGADFKTNYGKIKGAVMKYFFSRALQKFDKRIACSEMLADFLNKKYKYMHFDFVNNGVDTDKFCPIKDKIALRKKLGLPLNKKIVIWAGVFIPLKDPLNMVKAIKKTPQKEFFFVFCGKGVLLNTCKQELKNYKNVLFTGYIKNIAEYFQASDSYVSTSLSEGFHLTVYEAMACGLPVILTNIYGYKKLINSKSVWFYGLKDKKILSGIIEQLKCIENIDEISYNAARFIQNNYSIKIMSKEYQKKYLEII